VLAHYLYQHLNTDAAALSAGLGAGDCINDRAAAMLRHWGIDASDHRPRQLDLGLCEQADAMFIMGPSYLHRVLIEFGDDLASKAYLFADPFTKPQSFGKGEYKVRDPSFDRCVVDTLVREFAWMCDRVRQIRQALRGEGRPLIPATHYLAECRTVDPHSH
jgi:protein-tyrosine-phosphatase